MVFSASLTRGLSFHTALTPIHVLSFHSAWLTVERSLLQIQGSGPHLIRFTPRKYFHQAVPGLLPLFPLSSFTEKTLLLFS
jgi:hypothetical protein